MTSPTAQTPRAPEDGARGGPQPDGYAAEIRQGRTDLVSDSGWRNERGTDPAAEGKTAAEVTPSTSTDLGMGPARVRAPRGRVRATGSAIASREVTAQELAAARRDTGPINDGVALGVVPRVKANTDLGKASHSGRHDAPIDWSLEGKNEPTRDTLPRAARRIAHISARLKANAAEELKRFPIEQAMVWFLAGIAVALSILIATT